MDSEKAYDIGFQAGSNALNAIEDYFYGNSEDHVKDSLLGLLVFLMSSSYALALTSESAEVLISTAHKNSFRKLGKEKILNQENSNIIDIYEH